MARTNALAHVKVLSRVSGQGVYIADTTAKAGGLKLGGKLSFSTPSGGSLSLRIKGIYRALADSPESNYWTNLPGHLPVVRHIDPLPVDAPAPIFVLPAAELLIAAAGLVVVAVIAGVLTTWLAGRADVSDELRVA